MGLLFSAARPIFSHGRARRIPVPVAAGYPQNPHPATKEKDQKENTTTAPHFHLLGAGMIIQGIGTS
jgi:hypothetical protein